MPESPSRRYTPSTHAQQYGYTSTTSKGYQPNPTNSSTQTDRMNTYSTSTNSDNPIPFEDNLPSTTTNSSTYHAPPTYQSQIHHHGMSRSPLTITDLTQWDGIRIEQQMEELELAFRIETRNHYIVRGLQYPEDYKDKYWRGKSIQMKEDAKPVAKQPLFLTDEKSDYFSRAYLGANRQLQFHLVDIPSGKKAFVIKRPFRLFGKYVELFDFDGNYIGKIRKHFSLFSAKLEIFDAQNQTILNIKGPKYPGWHKLSIRDMDDKKVGLISKKWGGIMKEAFTDADTFDILFPPSTSHSDRVLVLAATLFIDMLWFENNQPMRQIWSIIGGSFGIYRPY